MVAFVICEQERDVMQHDRDRELDEQVPAAKMPWLG